MARSSISAGLSRIRDGIDDLTAALSADMRVPRAAYASGIWPRHRRRRSEEHTSELQSRLHLVCRLLLEKKKTRKAPRKTRSPDEFAAPFLSDAFIPYYMPLYPGAPPSPPDKTGTSYRIDASHRLSGPRA